MRLWRNQAFVVFWSACTISFAGTGITALAWWSCLGSRPLSVVSVAAPAASAASA